MNSSVLIGSSSVIEDLKEEIGYSAKSNAKVLITGESGVGKEIVARLIHQQSARRNGALVTINCAGFPDGLLESELFGHMKGSFTDAHRDHRGYLERAHGGTIFMDEVGEMSLRMQALMLRFLETGEIQRVGSDRRLPSLDVRVITATHRNLLAHVADKTFREDLYYRLNVVHITVPPLRERSSDIPALLMFFLQQASRTHEVPLPEVSREAMDALQAYRWPGNIRELKNVAERLVLRARETRIGVETLPVEVVGARPASAAAASVPLDAVADGRADELFERIIVSGESFWSVVYEPFMARDLTRDDVRDVIRRGLVHTLGNYKLLVRSFNMPEKDYKRFLNFLRKFGCHVPFQPFRAVPSQPVRQPESSATLVA